MAADRGITLDVHKAGSREIATLPDLRSYDVAFPAGQPAAEKIRHGTGTKRTQTAFSTPMVVASWKPIADVLLANGIVKREADAYWIVDMGKLLELMASGKRWRDLPSNSVFAVGKSVLVATTNVSTSNSAAQFLSLGSYLFNGSEVVQNLEQADRAALKVAPLFARQGFQESSSSGPFEDYLTIGMGKTPLVWIYEAQFLEQALQQAVKKDMVLLYPRPTIFTKHVMVSLSRQGRALPRRDGRARRRSASPPNTGTAPRAATGSRACARRRRPRASRSPDLVDLVDAPAFDLLEHMIVSIEHQRDHPAAAAPLAPRCATAPAGRRPHASAPIDSSPRRRPDEHAYVDRSLRSRARSMTLTPPEKSCPGSRRPPPTTRCH